METQRKVTVQLPGDLVDRAQKASGQGLTETIRQGLRLVAAGDTFRQVAKLRGAVKFSVDLARQKISEQITDADQARLVDRYLAEVKSHE